MLIGINGKRGSGKDSLANVLVQKYEFERISFADKLKESVSKLFEIPLYAIEGWKNDSKITIEVLYAQKRKKSFTFREFLQRYGVEAHRDVFGENFWVNLAFKDLDLENNNYVVSDCRFENELRRVHDLGGVTVRITRKGLYVVDPHVSESLPPDHLIDYFIKNDSSLDELELAVDELVDDINYYQQEEYSYDV